MPIPIKPLSNDKNDKEKINIDYSFLFNYELPENEKIVKASDSDADILFRIWYSTSNSNSKIRLDQLKDISKKDIIRLKAKGFISGNADEIQFTKKGRIIITTMALGEKSTFEKNRQNKKYTEILASMNKRKKHSKRGYCVASDILRYNINQSNNLNLRKIFRD